MSRNNNNKAPTFDGNLLDNFNVKMEFLQVDLPNIDDALFLISRCIAMNWVDATPEICYHPVNVKAQADIKWATCSNHHGIADNAD